MIWYLYGTVLGWLMRPRKGDIGCLECAVFGHPWQPSHRNRRKWWVLDACTVILTGKTVKPPWLDDYNLFWNWTFMFFFFFMFMIFMDLFGISCANCYDVSFFRVCQLSLWQYAVWSLRGSAVSKSASCPPSITGLCRKTPSRIR